VFSGAPEAAVAEVTVAERTGAWLDELAASGELTIVQRRRLAAEDGGRKLAPILRRIEIAGRDSRAALADAVSGRSLDSAQQISNVLVHRLTDGRTFDPIGASFADWAPATDDAGLAAQLAEITAAADARRRELGEQLGNALFYDWQFSGDNEEYLDPARYQYREFFILVDALFEGRPVSYCPYIFVDNDAALARGWTQGYPKRIGQVFQTRYHAATGKAGPALAPGSKFAGSLTAGGQRLAEGLVTLREPVTDQSLLAQRPVVNLLHYPRLAAGQHDKPVLHEIVENVPHDVQFAQAWIGEGFLSLPDCGGEEISALAPIRCGAGLRASMSYVVDDLKTLKDLR
jgi:hypothetical protein